MQLDDLEPIVRCADCQAELAVLDEPVFALDSERQLCARCAANRGGRFDAVENEWLDAPRVDDL